MQNTSPKTVVEVKNLNTFYGTRQILFDVSLDIVEKEIMVIMGHSGSGKSTLLRHILGLHQAESGSITLLGKTLTDIKRK